MQTNKLGHEHLQAKKARIEKSAKEETATVTECTEQLSAHCWFFDYFV